MKWTINDVTKARTREGKAGRGNESEDWLGNQMEAIVREPMKGGWGNRPCGVE
jgi:hypothetical protein